MSSCPCNLLQDGIGPLHIACFEGYSEVVNFLCRKRIAANIDVADDVRQYINTN